MVSDNTPYEQRIASGEDVVEVWRECLIEQANLSETMVDIVEAQAKAPNHKKPIGLFFDRMDWVVTQDPNYPKRLARDDVTKQGSLIESFCYFARIQPLNPERYSDYAPVSQDKTVITAAKVLIASELDEQEPVAQYDFSNLKGFVNSTVEYLEDQKIEEVPHPRR